MISSIQAGNLAGNVARNGIIGAAIGASLQYIPGRINIARQGSELSKEALKCLKKQNFAMTLNNAKTCAALNAGLALILGLVGIHKYNKAQKAQKLDIES